MTISEKFQIFCKNIRIDDNVVDVISYRYKRITKRLNIDFWGSDSEISHSLYVGSYGRGTAIPRVRVFLRRFLRGIVLGFASSPRISSSLFRW